MLLFTIGVLLYTLGVKVAALLGNSKAKQWVEGRKAQSQKLAERHAASQRQADWIWFHAASLGEFEQGRPVIEALKRDYPQCKILLSFFSPSGYEVRKDYPLADEVLYLPADTPKNAAAWIGRHHFVAAFFIKYEFWFNYMRALKEAGIPLFYISLILNKKSYFFKPYGKTFRKQLSCVSHFFVQDETTARLLEGIGYRNVTVCGDTRFDRVAAIAQQAKPFPEIERFIGGRHCIVAGSTWPSDESLLAGYMPKLPDGYCLIIAPHDISAGHVAQIQGLFPEACLYSELDAERPSKVLVVNTIGILSQLYQYARFAYIGGGFGAGIHNIQEPVTFGCPVVFGPKHKKFKEAVDLVALGGAFAIESQHDLDAAFSRLIADETFYAAASSICRVYLKSQLGATETILKNLPLSLKEA
ncbi:MAG: 3-deoxy-D-manno-octulosonic acid transferase [Bacteroidales bacterium]|nr:3-deoxy-D-manno-octulosonic acid transferase [Bacteroidales bacterium]